VIADRARSLRGSSEVTDLASSGPQRASQRGPAPEPRLRDAVASTRVPSEDVAEAGGAGAGVD
jgi:hypothetical protein